MRDPYSYPLSLLDADTLNSRQYDLSYVDLRLTQPSGNKYGSAFKRPKVEVLPVGMTGPPSGQEDDIWCDCHGSWHLR